MSLCQFDVLFSPSSKSMASKAGQFHLSLKTNTHYPDNGNLFAKSQTFCIRNIYLDNLIDYLLVPTILLRTEGNSMKAFSLTMMIILSAISICSGSSELFLKGNGSPSTPYQISTFDDLLLLSNNPSVWDKNFEQTTDIDASGIIDSNDCSGWQPAGTKDTPFTGSYDGHGHVIRNLTFREPRQDNVGFIGYAKTAQIKNLGLIDVDFSGNNGVGGLVGSGEETLVMASFVTGRISGNDRVGGLIGESRNSRITNSYSDTAVSGESCVGGIAGFNDRHSHVDRSYSKGRVSGVGSAGAITGCGLGAVTDSFWDRVTTGIESSNGGVGLLTVEIPDEHNPIYAKWDFESVWQIVNYTTYPFLRWQKQPAVHNYPPNGYLKTFPETGSYWESFPVLWDRDKDGYQDARSFLGETNEVHGIDMVETERGQMYFGGMSWVGEQVSLNSKSGNVLSVFEKGELCLKSQGEAGTPTNLPFDSRLTVERQSENWLGYFIPQSQPAMEAFKEVIEHINYIKAENWTVARSLLTGELVMDYIPETAGIDSPLLEYGKMYKVVISQDAPHRIEFQWNLPDRVYHSYTKPESNHFTYRKNRFYQTIYIDAIEDDEDVLEVAVFAGEHCIGASTFQGGYPLEILAYSTNFHRYETLSFAVIREGKEDEPEFFRVPTIFNTQFGRYTEQIVRPAPNSISMIRLQRVDNEEEYLIEPEVILYQNEPNPFLIGGANETLNTEISFFVADKRMVTLTLHDVRGELIKTLFAGNANAGKHQISWNGMDRFDRLVPTGVYIYRLDSGGEKISRRMLIME